MKSKIIIIVICGALIVLGFFFIQKRPVSGLLADPSAKTTAETINSSPLPSPSPENFQFNSSTDLKMQLDQVKPEISDTDFNALKQIVSALR